MPGLYWPTNDLVGVAWCKERVPEFAGLGIVATTLPDESSKWVEHGFVQIRNVAGGLSSVDLPIRRPVFQVDTWGVTPGSSKPAWGKANQLAECIRAATESSAALYGRPVTMPAGFMNVRVLSAYLMSNPRRVDDDPNGYARFTFDLVIDWAVAP